MIFHKITAASERVLMFPHAKNRIKKSFTVLEEINFKNDELFKAKKNSTHARIEPEIF